MSPQSQSSPPVVNSTPPPSQPAQQLPKLFLVLLILLLISVVTYLAYLLGRNSVSQVSPSPLPAEVPTQNQPIASPLTQTNPTVGWKTYINNPNKYSFKYPPGWVVRSYGGSNVAVEEANSYVIEGPYENIVTLQGAPKYAIRVESSTKKFTPTQDSKKYVLIKSSNDIFVKFELSSSEVPPSENLDAKTLDQILSTFKFTQ